MMKTRNADTAIEAIDTATVKRIAIEVIGTVAARTVIEAGDKRRTTQDTTSHEAKMTTRGETVAERIEVGATETETETMNVGIEDIGAESTNRKGKEDTEREAAVALQGAWKSKKGIIPPAVNRIAPVI